MDGRTLFVGLIFVALATVGLWYFFLRDSDDPVAITETGEVASRTYTNDVYRYSFAYPAGYTVEEYSDEVVAVGNREGDGFESLTDVAFVSSGEEGGHESFDEYLFERVRILCAADGPDVTMYCDAVESSVPFENKNGISGTEINLRLIQLHIGTGAGATSTFCPVYAFNVAANVPDSDHAALLVYKPLAAFAATDDTKLAGIVAESLMIDLQPEP
jgi:hypothetical protein